MANPSFVKVIGSGGGGGGGGDASAENQTLIIAELQDIEAAVKATVYAEDTAHISGDWLSVAGTVRRDTAISGANANADYQPLITDADGKLWVNLDELATLLTSIEAVLEGAVSTYRSVDLDESEEEIKDSAGVVQGWYLYNLAEAVRYIHFYDLDADDVTVGTTTPKLTLPLGAGQGANVVFPPGAGVEFSTGICIAATTTLTGDDAPGNNEIVANVFYV